MQNNHILLKTTIENELTEITGYSFLVSENTFMETNSEQQFPYSINVMPIFKKQQEQGLTNVTLEEFKLTIINQVNAQNSFLLLSNSTNGFINVYIDLNKLQNQHIEFKKVKQTVVIDYSSPNVAKEMHIGHLRSSIIGDSLARIYQYFGDNVVCQNHVGDFGKQFGLLIAFLDTKNINVKDLSLSDLEEYYIQAQDLAKSNEQFSQLASDYVTQLQNNNNEELKNKWKDILNLSFQHINHVYHNLNLLLKPEHIRGESFYQNLLPQVISNLKQKNITEEDNEVVLVRSNNDVIVLQRGNGAYLYATTDLAAIQYRLIELNADKVLYVVDTRQSQHFKQVFDIANKWLNYSDTNKSLHHVNFGTILNKDKTPFRTRDGGVVKLDKFITEAKERTQEFIKNRYSLNEEQVATDFYQNMIHKIAIGIIKYADLNKKRTNDYVFDWDQLLSMTDNSSIFIQYNLARVYNVLNKQNLIDNNETKKLEITPEIEKVLYLWNVTLLQFDDYVYLAYQNNEPHHICTYLKKLSSIFSNIYSTPNIKFLDENNHIAPIYQQLLKQTQTTLSIGLNLLGIDTLEKM